MESQSMLPGPATGLYLRTREKVFPAGSGDHKPYVKSHGLDRVYPIRSMIGIDPKNSDSVSSTSSSPPTSREFDDTEEARSTPISKQPSSRWGDGLEAPGWTTKTEHSNDHGEIPYITIRFTHRMAQDGHMVVTGAAGAEKVQKFEDEPIHAPGAVQDFGVLLVLHELADHTLKVRIASENSKEIIGYSPSQLFALNNFCEIMSEEQTEKFYENMVFVRDGTKSDPEVLSLHIIAPDATVIKLWCALSIHQASKDMILCEFELEEDHRFLVAPHEDNSPSVSADSLKSPPSGADIAESTQVASKLLRIRRWASQLRGEVAVLNVYRLTSQIQEQFAAAESMDQLMKVIICFVEDLMKFHRVMIYRFDSSWNGKVVTELVDVTKTKGLYKGLYFPAYDIPKQARDLYGINKGRLLYDRELRTARLVCRSAKDFEVPLDMTHFYVRAMSPIHLKYLEHMDVRASMSISKTSLWGLIPCHIYGSHGMRLTFPLRKMCTSKLQARKLINTVPSEQVPSKYIVASSEDLLKLFDADLGILSINTETKFMGTLVTSQEALALLEYLRRKRFKSLVACQHITGDYPDLEYAPGFQTLGGFLLVPICGEGTDFIVFVRKRHLEQAHWAGNPYERQGITGPRKSFKLWAESVRGECSEWTEDQVETAAVLCQVYGKFIEVWRQKKAAIQPSQITKIIPANASHEMRTPLNAIINFMEIALEGPLDKETRDNLSRSHVSSENFIHAINDLLDLTRTEEGHDLVKEEEFNLIQMTHDIVNAFNKDIEKKGLMIDTFVPQNFPEMVKGDELGMRQCLSMLLENAVKYTDQGGITVEVRIVGFAAAGKVEIEIVVQDTGIGMNAEDMDILFRQLEQVGIDDEISLRAQHEAGGGYMLTRPSMKRMLGLEIAKIGPIIQTIGGQLRVISEKDKGSRFTMQLPLSLPGSPLGRQYTPPLLSRTRKSEKGSKFTLVGCNRPSMKQSQRQQSTRKASYESLEKSRRSSTSELDSLVSAMRSVIPRGREPFYGSSCAVAEGGSLERGDLKFTMSSKVWKGTSQHRPPKVLEISNFPKEEPVAIASSAVNDSTPLAKAMSPMKSRSTAIGYSAAEEVILANTQAMEKKIDGKCLSVLIAEDDTINSLILKKRMEKLSYNVKVTENGQQCADAFKADQDKYDLILMDMEMPIMDGGTATALIREAEIVRRDSAKCRIPIFAISTSLVEGRRLEYMRIGFDGWLLKPVDFKRLLVLIRGIDDEAVRNQEKYTPGKWGAGGWFIRESGELSDGSDESSLGRDRA
ncbi:hypothetical protein EV426DRAFT_135295 [Tirmania nivea]|nr:hypothetical protein EV426DRAFT_135295 [Tirmania nivea]